jgi:hypothetical protein
VPDGEDNLASTEPPTPLAHRRSRGPSDLRLTSEPLLLLLQKIRLSIWTRRYHHYPSPQYHLLEALLRGIVRVRVALLQYDLYVPTQFYLKQKLDQPYSVNPRTHPVEHPKILLVDKLRLGYSYRRSASVHGTSSR